MPTQSAPDRARPDLTVAGRIKSVGLQVLGWLLVGAGLLALVLPGPGLLMVFAGLAILSQRYAWAERRLRPVEIRAMQGAAQSVQTWPRIVMATLFALGIGGFGLIWLLGPAAPTWWPLSEFWWLPGGRATGITLLASCAIALGLLGWSYRRFHGDPEAVARIGQEAATN